MSLLESLAEEGATPLQICQSLRALIVASLTDDLPEGMYPYQTRFSDKMIEVTLAAEGDEVINSQCRQSGKTETVCITILTLSLYFAKVLKKHFRVGVFAPAGSQTVLIVKERLRRRYTKIKPLMDALNLKLITGDSIYSELFILSNTLDSVDARVRCLSIGERSNVTSETLNLIIIEQSEDVAPLKMTQEVFPMAAAVGGAIVLDGTPKNVVINTYFYDALTKREANDDTIIVDYIEAGLYNKKYKLYAEKQKEKLGEDSIAFRTQYGVEWVLGVDKFTNLDEMQDLSRKEHLVIPRVDGVPIFKVYAGFDVAKEADRSVVTWGFGEGDRAHIIEWLMMEGTDYSQQAKIVAKRCVELGTTQICVDSAGVGDPVIDFLKKELREIEGGTKVKVLGIRTNDAHEEDVSSKLMAKVWKNKLIDYPGLEEAKKLKNRRERAFFIEEFIDLNKTWRSNMMRVEAPKGYDKHDDFPKSCGLMLRSIMKPPVKIVIREI